MVHLCMIKSVVMWLHILVVSLLVCVCRTVREWTLDIVKMRGTKLKKSVDSYATWKMSKYVMD